MVRGGRREEGSGWGTHVDMLKPGLENFEHYFIACEMSAVVR